jgi:hypothetical protein
MIRYAAYPFGYVWTSTNTMLGLACLPLAIMTGGRARYRRGALELYGGFAAWFLSNVCRAGAMTLGHVILGRDREMLDHTHNHEHVHVVQYMFCGPFFLPLYGLSSALCWMKGKDYYRENWFEKPAYSRHPC